MGTVIVLMLTSSTYKFIKFYASVSLSVRFFSFIVWFFFMLLLFVFFSVDFVNPLINLLAFFHYSLDTWI